MDEHKFVIFEDGAVFQKSVTLENVWVMANGLGAVTQESLARHLGSTHSKCQEKGCGQILPKGQTICGICTKRKTRERWLKLPKKSWDEKIPVGLLDSSDYFYDMDDIYNFCIENDVHPNNLLLIHTEEKLFPEFDFCHDYLSRSVFDKIDEDASDHFSNDEIEKINDLVNSILKNKGILYYSDTDVAVDLFGTDLLKDWSQLEKENHDE